MFRIRTKAIHEAKSFSLQYDPKIDNKSCSHNKNIKTNKKDSLNAPHYHRESGRERLEFPRRKATWNSNRKFHVSAWSFQLWIRRKISSWKSTTIIHLNTVLLFRAGASYASCMHVHHAVRLPFCVNIWKLINLVFFVI